jgi:signal transduction histidine kinase/ActR/RegA family two-component response regulator
MALNGELEDKQDKLEETSAEMEAQLEEITALNDELEDKQGRLGVACKQAEAANNAKTSFLFNMSHDIRTPMNAIIGFTDLLEKHQEEPDKRADYLKKIQDSSAVLLSIINNVLEMARIEKGTLVIDEVAWSAEQFSDSLYSVFEDMMRQKNLEFTREIDVEHEYVFCDPIKLREVFINILSNAYKYTNAGGKINMRQEEIPTDREGYAIYKTTISDTGMGMSEDFLPHIFEEFSRENNTTDNKIEGTGLGMPIVKRLVEFMGGTIEVTSRKGVGSTFIVTIPHKIAEKPDLVEHTTGELDVDIFKGKRILLAEDNELNAEIAIEILGEAGFEVERAADGQICVDMVKKSEDFYYDLILMDIQMPNLNGYEATKAIRALPDVSKSNITIIAMTANAFEEDKRDAKRAGMNGHLAKPVDVKQLYKTLMRIFAAE